MTKPGLDRKTLFYYSLTDLPISLSIFPVIVFIPRFYASDVGVPLALVGTIMIAVRVFDVVTDPLMGYLSDRTETRFGRRKPWVAMSAPLLMIAIYALFLPGEDAGSVHFLVWSMVLSLATTVMLIPYYAWGAELTTDYHERSRVTGARAMAGVVGSLAAQVAPAIVLIAFGLGGSAVVLEVVAWTMLVLTPICVALTVLRTPEPPIRVTTRVPILPGLRLM